MTPYKIVEAKELLSIDNSTQTQEDMQSGKKNICIKGVYVFLPDTSFPFVQGDLESSTLLSVAGPKSPQDDIQKPYLAWVWRRVNLFSAQLFFSSNSRSFACKKTKHKIRKIRLSLWG